MTADVAAPGDQPPPTPNDQPSVHRLVCLYLQGRVPQVLLDDLMDRARIGHERYGTWLQAGNGRDARWDGYQEALDGLAYAGQLIAETPDDQETVAAQVGKLIEAQLAACIAWARLVHPAGEAG